MKRERKRKMRQIYKERGWGEDNKAKGKKAK